MGYSTHRFRVREARRTNHPVFSEISKYVFTVAAVDLPSGISTAANAREPVGLNRRVYRDVRESLEGKTSQLGSFDLMNKGITLLAHDVRLVDKDQGLYDIEVDDLAGGIVDGAHTAKIIWESNKDGTTPPEQHVEVYVRTGLPNDLITDIARGLNTGMQVAPKSIYNIDGVFDWLKNSVLGTAYESSIAWKESDSCEYDVRDLISMLELFNVFDYPNDSSGRHPIAAYEKWSIPLEKFAKDFEANRASLKNSTYYRLRRLLPGALELYDHVRADFRPVHNSQGGAAGKMNIVEEAAKNKTFKFVFAGLPDEKYRLTKGAAYPMMAAFRNYVEVDPNTGEASWKGGFSAVLQEWKDAAPELVRETALATQDISHMPEQLGKNRKHWDNLHMKVQLRVLRAQLLKQRESAFNGKGQR